MLASDTFTSASRAFRGLAALLFSISLVFLPSASDLARACTLWCSVGDAAQGGGALLAKNRDFSPESYSRLVLVRPQGGEPFVGLYAMVEGTQNLVGGVNRAGLAIVSSTASSVPKDLRKVPSHPKGLTGLLLATCTTVEQALTHRDWFAGHSPTNYMLADKDRTAWVEVAPGGAVAVREASRGSLAHTNHYVATELEGANTSIGTSSASRLEAIQQKLAAAPVHSLDDYLRFSADTSRGPDNSIFRRGSKPTSGRTMAVFMVKLPPKGNTELIMDGYGDPATAWKVRLTLDSAFWQQGQAGSSVLLASDTAFPDVPLPTQRTKP